MIRCEKTYYPYFEVGKQYEIVIDKHDPRVIAIKEKIDSEYAADRISAISDDEMNAWIKKAFGKKLPPLKL